MRYEASAKKGSSEATGWQDSPWISFTIRAAVFAVPVLLSLGVTWFLASLWTAPTTISAALVRLVALGLTAVAVGASADRVARRFLPLAALFRLSLVFPDQAPSRFAVALRSGNTRRLQERLGEIESGGFRGDQVDAASLIVELAASLSEHDRLTRGHSERVRAYTALIGEEMGLGEDDRNKLQWAGLIHDVGKLRIPAEILTKPGKLTHEEFEVIKTHPAEGVRLAEPLADFLGPWIGAVGEHHERFDGGGYPNGIAGTDISLAGRIVAVADAYDVITAARSYKKPLSPTFARRELAENAGGQFDPVVVRAFLSISLGQLRRAMWPLSWALQVPFLGTAITTPVAQTVAASIVTLATATGVTVATGGLDAFDPPPTPPPAIALVDDEVLESGAAEVMNTEAGTEPAPSTTAPSSTGQRVDSVATVDDLAVGEAESEVPNQPTTSAPANGPDQPLPEPGDQSPSTPSSGAPVSNANATTSTTVPVSSAPGVTSTTISRPVRTTTTTLPLEVADCSALLTGDLNFAGADLRDADLSDSVLVDSCGLQLRATRRNELLQGHSFVGDL